MDTFAVIGLGRFGTRIAKKLYAMNYDVLVIDIQEDNIQQIAGDVTRAVIGDARDKDVLRAAGVTDCDCAIVAIGNNLEASVMASMNLKELNVPYVVCKAQGKIHKRILEKIGADRVIIPEQESADRLARMLAEPNILEHIELSPDYGIIEEAVPDAWVGKTIRDLNIRAKYGFNVIAVRRAKEMTIAPDPDYAIAADDTMVLLGKYVDLDKLRKK